jgi:hypothetical protein
MASREAVETVIDFGQRKLDRDALKPQFGIPAARCFELPRALADAATHMDGGLFLINVDDLPHAFYVLQIAPLLVAIPPTAKLGWGYDLNHDAREFATAGRHVGDASGVPLLARRAAANLDTTAARATAEPTANRYCEIRGDRTVARRWRRVRDNQA